MSEPAPPAETRPPAEPDRGGVPIASDDEDDELELVITAKEGVLEELGVTDEEFGAAVERALDLLEDAPDDEGEPPAAVEDVEVTLNGRLFRLAELADVEIAGDLAELGEFPPEDAGATTDASGEEA